MSVVGSFNHLRDKAAGCLIVLFQAGPERARKILDQDLRKELVAVYEKGKEQGILEEMEVAIHLAAADEAIRMVHHAIEAFEQTQAFRKDGLLPDLPTNQV